MSAVLQPPVQIAPPTTRRLLSNKSGSAVLTATLIVAVLVPILNLWVPADSVFQSRKTMKSGRSDW